ncbi:inorganic diphosphatase [Microvirga flavescens]|uniref:inorganic diphosphatase n=1 Tax=Microvirga flavescens TaxID=2249811 RepID=UPI003CCA8388
MSLTICDRSTEERNDRLMAVATHAHNHMATRSFRDLRPGLVDEIEAFFKLYNKFSQKRFRSIARRGPKQALNLIENGMKLYQRAGGEIEGKK